MPQSRKEQFDERTDAHWQDSGGHRSGGIRRAICLAFASAGAKVACLDINLAAAEKTAGASGNEAIAQHCDVSSETETRDAAAATISKFKAVHILVNAAATDDRNGTILDITAEERSRVVAVNVTGAFLMSRAVLPSMIAADGGSIIHIASQLGRVAAPNRAAYCTSKGALIQLAKTMAVDHAGQNTRVNALSPGGSRDPLPTLAVWRHGTGTTGSWTEASAQSARST